MNPKHNTTHYHHQNSCVLLKMHKFLIILSNQRHPIYVFQYLFYVHDPSHQYNSIVLTGECKVMIKFYISHRD